MKKLISPVIWLVLIQFPVPKKWDQEQLTSLKPVNNLFIITLDGFRWQELFTGADSVLINTEKFTPDAETIKLQYWAGTPEERRKKLMPFFWNVIAAKGQLFGNRRFRNNVDAANLHSLSYPGYNEILTGNTGFPVTSNRRINNPNLNVLEYLNSKEAFKGKVAVFTSWDVFPYILNSQRSKLPVNCGNGFPEDNGSGVMQVINSVQATVTGERTATRYDMLTFLKAREYIQRQRPRVVFLGLGEGDETAHDGRYDLYLQHATQADRLIAELWHWVQTTPGYKDQTTFIITTDHGRGNRTSSWTSHGEFIRGSSQAWFAMIGPGIQPCGEIKEAQQHYLEQMARTIAKLLGEDFKTTEAPPPVSLIVSANKSPY